MSQHEQQRGFGTRAIKAATRVPPVEQGPAAVPIYQSATFHAQDVGDYAQLIGFEKAGYTYSRIENPTATALASAFAEMHGAEAGFAFGSGMGAIHAALLSLLKAGDRIVCTQAVYGSTRALMERVLAPLGVETVSVDPTDLEAVERALAAAPTRLLYAETISNPTIVVADLERLAELGHGHGAVVVVDNTFASPYLCRPLELGVDVVVESATKWLSGHSDVIAGAVAGTSGLHRGVFATWASTPAASSRPSAPSWCCAACRRCTCAWTDTASLPWPWPGCSKAPPAWRAWPIRACPATPRRRSPRGSCALGGGMLAVDLGSPDAAAALHRRACSIPPVTATLGSVVTYAVHPPTATHRQLERASSSQPPASLRDWCASPSASRTSTTCSPTWTRRLDGSQVEAGVSA